MSVLPILLVATLGGTAALLLRRRPDGGAASVAGVALLALVAVMAAGLPVATGADPGGGAVVPDDPGGAALSLLDRGLLPSTFLRLVVTLWAVAGLLLVGLAALTVPVPALAGATLLGLAAAVVALASADAVGAVLAALVAGLAGLLATTPAATSTVATAVAARELRTIVVAAVAVTAGAVAVPALAASVGDGSSGGATGGLTATAPAVGAATLAVALGLALRMGAVPFHRWAARVADVAPGIALPLLLGWTPLVLGSVAITVVDAQVAPLALPLDGEQAVILFVGALTLVAGSFAAWIQDDLEHTIGYLAIAGAGMLLVGLAAMDPAAWTPTRTWLVVLALATTVQGAWVVAVTARFGTRRLPELDGWARRAPVLGVGLGLTMLATVGLPGWAGWEARRVLAELALPGPLGLALTLAGLAPLAPLARIAAVGLRPPLPGVADAPSERPDLVAIRGAREAVRGVAPRVAAMTVGRAVAASVGVNRTAEQSALVLLIGLLATAVSLGAFGLVEAAAALPPVAVSDGISE